MKEPELIVDLSKVPDGTLGNDRVHLTFQHVSLHSLAIDKSHLSLLVAALSTVYQWFPLGIHLGLSYSDLKTIDQNQRGQVEMCRIDVLAMWLEGPEEKCNNVSSNALKQLVLSLPPNTSAGE